MSLESIVDKILSDAHTKKDSIIRQAKLEKERIIQEARDEAEGLYRELVAREKSLYEQQKARLIVNARLAYKKNLLQAKHELIDGVINKLQAKIGKDRFRKQRIYADKTQEVAEDTGLYLVNARQDFETDIADTLFR